MKFWSKIVHPGRCTRVDPGEGNTIKITNITFLHPESAEFRPYLGNDRGLFAGEKQDAECAVFLGINRTKFEYVVGNLHSRLHPQLSPIDLRLKEPFTLSHSGFGAICFNGYTSTNSDQEAADSDKEEIRKANKEAWPLSLDLTAKVMSMLDSSSDVAHAESISRIFGQAGKTSLPYTNINLTSTRHAEDLIALMCMRRSYGQLRSLALGCSQGDDLNGDDLNVLYTSRFLEPLQQSSLQQSSMGKYLKKLHLFEMALVDQDHLRPVLAQCSILTDLEILSLRRITVEFVLEMAASHCPLLEQLLFFSSSQSVLVQNIADDTLHKFVKNCARVKSLGLCGVSISDSQLFRILQGFKRLACLNLSRSYTFTGSFLIDEKLISQNQIQELILDRCENLLEDSLGMFVQLLSKREYFPNLQRLIVRGNHLGVLTEGFGDRIGVDVLRNAREMVIETRFELPNEDGMVADMHEDDQGDGLENIQGDQEDEIDDDWQADAIGDGVEAEHDPEGFAHVAEGELRRKRFIYW